MHAVQHQIASEQAHLVSPAAQPINRRVQAYQWLDLLNKRIVDFKIEGDEVIVQFHGDGSKWDARDKKNLLPTSVAPEAVGTKIRIRNPDIFVDWLQSASISYPLKLKREVKKLLRKKFHISR